MFQKLFGYAGTKADGIDAGRAQQGQGRVSAGDKDKVEADVAKLHAAGLWATMQRRERMNGWKKAGRGAKARLVGTFDAQEAAVLRGLLDEVRQMLAERSADTPADELAVLTGSLRTGPSTRPNDRVLARLLPDFTTEDADLAAGLRSLHEPELIEAKDRAAADVLAGLPAGGGRVELTPAQGDVWLAALNDVRLALGTALDVSEDMPDDIDPDDPRAAHLGIYHWLTFVQDGLVQSRMMWLAGPVVSGGVLPGRPSDCLRPGP